MLPNASLPSSSSNSFFKSASGSGSLAVSNAASSIRFTSCKLNDGESMGQFHIYRCVGFLLRELDQGFARQLEYREKGHDQLRNPELRVEQLGEFQEPDVQIGRASCRESV